MNLKVTKKLLMLILAGTIFTTGCSNKNIKEGTEIAIENDIFKDSNLNKNIFNNEEFLKLKEELIQDHILEKKVMNGDFTIDIYNKDNYELCGNVIISNNNIIANCNFDKVENYNLCHKEYFYSFNDNGTTNESNITTIYSYEEDNNNTISYSFLEKNKEIISQMILYIDKNKNSKSIILMNENDRQELVVTDNELSYENILEENEYSNIAKKMYNAGIKNDLSDFITYLRDIYSEEKIPALEDEKAKIKTL